MIVRARKRGLPEAEAVGPVAGAAASDGVIELNLARNIEDRLYTAFFILVGLFFVYVVGFTGKQAVLGLFVDSIALLITLRIQPAFIWRWTPQYKKVFPKFSLTERDGKALSEKARLELYELLRSWPYERAKNAFVLSLFKAIPVSVLALFAFDRVFSWPVHASLYLGIEFLLLLDFAFLCYIQAHEEVSRFFKQVHQRDDWSTTFERVGFDEADVSRFQKVETIGFWAVLVMTILGVTTVSVGRKWESEWQLLGSVIFIVALGAGFLAQLVSIHRRFLVNGLVQIIHSLGTLEKGPQRRLIALSSWSLFSGFESAFNRLVRRLDRRERELGQLMNRFAEESRLLTLGEISGLVVHDLGNTLHMAQFAAASLDRSQDPEIARKLKDELQSSLDRLGALISTLRLRLENRQGAHAGCNLGTIQGHVGRFLELQFKEAGFRQATWLNSDPRVQRVRVGMPQSELFQVLENLFRNSVQSILRAQPSKPELGIRIMADATPGRVTLEVFDNGTGISLERFAQLTAPDDELSGEVRAERSLGLRLTRRLVEQYGGTLSVNPHPAKQQDEPRRQGASFLVRLPGEIVSNEEREQGFV